MKNRPGPHEERLVRYYQNHTEKFYLDQWDRDDIHFGLFDEGTSIEFYFLIPEQERIRKAAVLRMTEAVVRPAQIQPQDFVVDAGCGVGGTLIYLARTFGCRATGINISQHQLDLAARKIDEAGFSGRIELLHGNCSDHLPLPDGSVDVLVNIESACQYSDRDRFLAECARILKPGGRMVVQDWVQTDNVSPEDYPRFLAPFCETWRIRSMETPRSYRQRLEENGFDVVELVDLAKGVKPNLEFMRSSARRVEKCGETLNEDEQFWQRHLKSISDAYFAGHMTVIRYFALLKG